MVAPAAVGKITIPVAQAISLAHAPAVLTSLEQGKRLNGKAIIALSPATKFGYAGHSVKRALLEREQAEP